MRLLVLMLSVQLPQDSGLYILNIPQYLLEVVLVELLLDILPQRLGLAPAASLHFIIT